MARWGFVYYTQEEIQEAIEDILRMRIIEKEKKAEVEEARKAYTHEPMHFDNISQLADYAQEMEAKHERVEEARISHSNFENGLRHRKEALKSIIPPGGSVLYEANDGTTYRIHHRSTGYTDTGTAIYFHRTTAQAAEPEPTRIGPWHDEW